MSFSTPENKVMSYKFVRVQWDPDPQKLNADPQPCSPPPPATPIHLLPLLFSSMLARIQFISLWTVAKQRSDHAHLGQTFLDCSSLRGATWLLPLPSLPSLLYRLEIVLPCIPVPPPRLGSTPTKSYCLSENMKQDDDKCRR